MPRKSSIMHAVVVGTTVALVSGAAAAPALADPPTHSNASSNGQQHAADPKDAKDPKGNQGKAKGKAKGNQGQGATGNQGKGKGKGASGDKPTKPTKPAKPSKPTNPGQGGKGGSGDPAGNNGTVKIETLGDLDGIPNNTPHPGCTFQVEWYGYDEGADVVSTVTFAGHAPTGDALAGVDGPASVFVGGDPATGAGTPTGLDGTATYTLSFDGEPHPKQGYHVKLTVATPRSLGNDTKTKIFWVEPCEADAAEGAANTTTTASDDDTTVAAEEATSDSDTDTEVLGTQASTDSEPDVSGSSADVPSAVDAGEEGDSFSEWARSPLPLALAGLGLLVAAGAFLLRRRSRA